MRSSVSAIKIVNARNVFLNSNTFEGTGNLVVLEQSQANISNCTFQKSKGSTLCLWKSTTKISSCTFTENEGTGDGGAIFAKDSEVHLEWNFFSHNSDPCRGGAIHSHVSTLEMSQSNMFYNNQAVNTERCTLIATFQGGGAVNAIDSEEIIVAGIAHFKNNTATAGGAVYLHGF